MDEGRYNIDPRNRNLKRTNCSPWNEGFEPYNHRPRYQEDSFHHQGYYQNQSRYYSDQQNFNNYGYNNNYEFSINSQNNRNVPQVQNIYIGTNVFVTGGSVYNNSNIDSKDNTFNGSFQNNNFTSTGTNPRSRNPEHSFTNNQRNEEAKTVQMYICPQTFDLKEVGEINNNSNNVEDNNAHPAAEIITNIKSVSMKVAIKEKNIELFLKQLDEYKSKHQIELYTDKTNNLKRLNYNSLNQNLHFCEHVC